MLDKRQVRQYNVANLKEDALIAVICAFVAGIIFARIVW